MSYVKRLYRERHCCTFWLIFPFSRAQTHRPASRTDYPPNNFELHSSMGCNQSVSADNKSFDPQVSPPTVYVTGSSRTYVFDGQAKIPDNYCVPEIHVIDTVNLQQDYVNTYPKFSVWYRASTQQERFRARYWLPVWWRSIQLSHFVRLHATTLENPKLQCKHRKLFGS